MQFAEEPDGGIAGEPGRVPASSPRPDWLAAFRWVGTVAVIVTSGVLYATLPPSPDQWFLGYTGWRLTQGAIPYHGFADGNWPACHWLHALSVLLFGNTPYTWRVFDFGLMLVSTLFASRTASSLWSARAASWLLVLYPALYVVLGRWFAGERDIVGAHFLLVALWFYWSGLSRRRPVFQIGTGALIALSVLVKPTFSLFGLFLALHCLFAVSTRMCTLQERLLHVVVAGVSSFAGIAAGFAFLLLEGTSPAMFWDLAVQSIVIRYGNDAASPSQFLRTFLQYFVGSWHWISAGAAAGLAANLLRRGPDWAARNLLFPALWVTGIVSYVLQAQGLGYTLGVSYAATVPILCSGLGLISFRHRPLRGWRTVLLAALAAVPVLGTAKKWSSEFRSSARWLTGRITAEAHYAAFGAGDGISTAEAMTLAAELKRTIPPGGTILVWGRANVVNFLARRPQPTRFHHNAVIMRSYLPARLSRRWNAWFREEVEENAPQACLVNEGELQGPSPLPESVTFLKDYLAKHYVRVRGVGESGLYLRR
jgi:hypothetical protein